MANVFGKTPHVIQNLRKGNQPKKILRPVKKPPTAIPTKINVAEPATALNTLNMPTADLDDGLKIGPAHSGKRTKRSPKKIGIVRKKGPIGANALQRQKRMQNAKAHTRRINLLPYAKMSADGAPETNDKDAKGLWGCDTLEAVEAVWHKWNRTFRRKVTEAIARRIVPDPMRMCIDGLFDGTTTSSTIMTNEKILSDAWHYLHAELVALAAQDLDFEVAFVTIIAGTGATSHAKPVIDLHAAQAKCQTTLRAMSPNFFAISELVLFNSTPYPDGGQLLQEHTHALVFGVGAMARALEIGATHMTRFEPNATNAPQIDVRSVDTDPVNLARICAYMFKAPHRSMNWCPPRGGKKGHMNQSEKGDRNLRYLRVAMIRAMLTIDDATFAGGAGHRIRSQIIKMARPKCAAECPPQRRLLHPDAIGAFCVELTQALCKTNWSLPVIKRQK